MKKLIFFFAITFFFSCGSDDTSMPEPQDNFDRQAMLAHWADNIIIPAFTAFAQASSELKIATASFSLDPNLENYQILISQWRQAYLAFQEVSMFEIGKAEEVSFTNNLNIYPADVDGMEQNVFSNDLNLELPSEIDKQGFPALDYLLFSKGEDEAAVVDFYQNDPDAASYLAYINILSERIDNLTQAILTDWNGDFRNSFVNNSGNSANASVDKLVNDYIFYYERHLRAGKIGIPAGVFSGNPLSQKVEAFYQMAFSKQLFQKSLNAVQNFFNGKHFESNETSPSLKDYLNYLNVEKEGENLSQVINNQFDTARNAANELSDNFVWQVENDHTKMLATYDQLQINVVHLKVDMLQALNINVDYIDADGD